jgi:hypothetical protein
VGFSGRKNLRLWRPNICRRGHFQWRGVGGLTICPQDRVSGQDRGYLTEGIIKGHRSLCKSLKVWCDHMRIAIDGELRPKIVVHYVKEIVSWVEFEIGWCAATETREEELERKRERRR